MDGRVPRGVERDSHTRTADEAGDGLRAVDSKGGACGPVTFTSLPNKRIVEMREMLQFAKDLASFAGLKRSGLIRLETLIFGARGKCQHNSRGKPHAVSALVQMRAQAPTERAHLLLPQTEEAAVA
jgi:hypothetical protein